MSVYTAVGSVLSEDGYFSVRLRYEALYAHTDVGDIHTLLRFSDDARLYFRGSDDKFVLEVHGEDLATDAVTFTSGTEIHIEVEHTQERRRLTVIGVGIPKVTGDPLDPVVVDEFVYVLGTEAGAEEVGLLKELRPLNVVTFAELTQERMLAQMKEGGNFAQLLSVLSEQSADFYDMCLYLPHAFTLESAYGLQLDIIGSVVGLAREGFGDDRYRELLGIQIELLLAVGRDEAEWTGTCPNLLRIVRKFIGVGTSGLPVTLTNIPPYAYQIDVPDLDLSEADLLVRFLTTATYGGVHKVVTAILDEYVWDAVEADVEGGGIWDSVEGDVPGALTWSMLL